MLKKCFCLLTLCFIASACNTFGGLDSPSGDDQLKVAARACLDSGDYPCAHERYSALSTSSNDVKVSELSFTVLREQNIFSISDLVASLGSNRGDQTTFINLAQLMASRGKTDGATRTVIQAQYLANASVNDPNLRAFMQLMVATAMFTEILSTAVGTDGVLTASDIVDAANVTACKNASFPICTPCTSTAKTLANISPDVTDLSTATNWSTAGSFTKLQVAATAAANQLGTLAPNNANLQGILNQFNTINTKLIQASQAGIPSLVEQCERQAVLQTLFP